MIIILIRIWWQAPCPHHYLEVLRKAGMRQHEKEGVVSLERRYVYLHLNIEMQHLMWMYIIVRISERGYLWQ